MLPEFSMLVPQSLEEAVKWKADISPSPVPVAGGTNVVVDLRNGRCEYQSLINIAGLSELSGISQENGNVTIGGGVTITEIFESPVIRQNAPCLHQAAGVFANPLICNRATVGGNLADASPAADTAPSLLVLDASVDLVSHTIKRSVPLKDFFLHVRKTVLQPQEIIAAVHWKIPFEKSSSAFYKIGLRKSDAISVASAAVMIEGGDNYQCHEVRIALGSVAPCPLRIVDAEDRLRGVKLTDEAIAEAARLAGEAVSPIDDVRASASYRREMAGVLVARLLKQAAAEIWK